MATPFYFETDAQAKRALELEGRRLLEIALKVWREYIGSYKPKKYVRTGNSEASIELKTVKRIDENTWGIEVTFKNDLAYHPSVVKGGKQGHAVMLISSGWKKKNRGAKGVKSGVPHFKYYEGFDYIGKVMKEFNREKNKGVELELQWSGKYTKK